MSSAFDSCGYRFRPLLKLWLIPLGLMAAMSGGCTPAPNQPGGTAAKGKEAPKNAQEAADQLKESQCSDLLSSLLGQFANPQVVLNFDPGQSVSLLNQWGRTCRPTPATLSADDLAKIGGLAGDSVLKLIQDEIYSRRDVEHLQTCVWMSIVKQSMTQGLSDDLDRANALFNYVIRNMSLESEHPEGTPFSLNGILFSGRGTTEDRTWLFLELLKQLRIDAIVISPARSADAETAPVPALVGVIVRGELHLFDPALGIAVPAKPEPIIPGTTYPIATLAEAAANPEILKRLGTPERPFVLNAENLPQAEYAFYGHSGWWAPRQLELAEHFVGPTQAEIYDGLTDLRERKGLLTRLQGIASKLPEGVSLKFWDYAERQGNARDNMNSLQQQVITRMIEVYSYPLVQQIEGNDSLGTFDDPTNSNRNQNKPKAPPKMEMSGDYFQARGWQILGAPVESVKVYMHNQRNSRLILDVDDPRITASENFQRIRDLHARVMNDATYWTGICKLEQKSPDSNRIAQDKFNQYVREYPEGTWRTSSLYHLALLAAGENKKDQAVELLAKIPEGDPLRDAANWFVREFGGGKSDPAKPAESTPEPVTEEKKPEGPVSESTTPPEEKPAEEKPAEEKPESQPEPQPDPKPETPPAESEENKPAEEAPPKAEEKEPGTEKPPESDSSEKQP